MPLLVNTISRTEATERVHNWLNYAKAKFGFQTTDAIPKAIFIPREDVEDALKEFERFDTEKRKASGIRIYFTKKFADDLSISCVVVPTIMSNLKDKNTGRPIHNDAIITIPALRKSVGADIMRAPNGGEGGGGGEETIYDFTSPCPTDCNGTTEWV